MQKHSPNTIPADTTSNTFLNIRSTRNLESAAGAESVSVARQLFDAINSVRSLNFLKNTIFIDAPRPIPNLEDFNNLGKDYFIIQDQKTEGLTGPVRATQKKKEDFHF